MANDSSRRLNQVIKIRNIKNQNIKNRCQIINFVTNQIIISVHVWLCDSRENRQSIVRYKYLKQESILSEF